MASIRPKMGVLPKHSVYQTSNNVQHNIGTNLEKKHKMYSMNVSGFCLELTAPFTIHFPFSSSSTLTMEPTQPPLQQVPWALSP